MVGGVEYWKLTATLAVVFSLAMWLLTKIRKKSETAGENLPPGPKKLPIIGNLHLISDPPFRSFRDLAKQHGPIMHVKVGGQETIIVTSPDIAKEVLKDNDPVFADRPESLAMTIFWYNYINMAFSPYGAYWRQMRKICIVELLSAKSVRSFGSIRRDEVRRLVESLHVFAGEPVDLTRMLSDLMSSITCRAAFGKTVLKDKESLLGLVRVGTEMGAGTTIADIFPASAVAHALSWGTKLRLMRMRRKLDEILDDIIRVHQTNSSNGEFGNEDLVDVLLRVKESGQLEFPIGYDNIKAVILDMFAAGTETSASMVDWAMTELLRHPQSMAKAQAEVRQVVKEKGNNNNNNNNIEEEDVQKMSYLKLVIMEILRLHPPVSMLHRRSREPCKIRGYTIPAKVNMFVNIWAIQRDPKYWSVDPESFVPERFASDEASSLDLVGNDTRFMPFGSGRRSCPGLTFGWASAVLPLAHLLYNFDWKLPEGVDAQALNMIETNGIATPRTEHLLVVATPHQP